MAENSSIIICGQKFDVGRRVITFEDDPAISAYTPHCVSKPEIIYPWSPAKGLGANAMRYRGRRLIGSDRSLSRLQQIVKQFVIHHDGMGTSRDCFRVLHDERGLSVHFLIDNNGDIYQTLDLVECAFQAAGVNEISIGVELCSRGDKINPGEYPAEAYRKFNREQRTCTINGHQWLAWEYTKDQYDSMTALGRALARLFPALPQVHPQGGDGDILWATLAADPREFAGYLGHYHVTNQKWDPGPFDFRRFVQSIRGRTFYPSVPGSDKSELPDEPAKVEELAQALYDNNEKEGEGGYFPVGPMGETRLWHGGLHLRQERGTPVVAPFAGKIVVARQKREDDWPPVGSNNMVLIRHEMAVAGSELKFYTLLLHLDFEDDAGKKPNWLKSAADKKWKGDLEGGEVTILDEAVAAGEVIGHFGEAGRPGNWKGQIHFEIFAEEELGAKIDPGFWKTIDGANMGRFCSAPEIVAPIDANKNGTLAPSEFVSFFHNNQAREQFRTFTTHHVSEWGDKNDWEVSLNKARDYGSYPKAKKHQLFVDQIESYLWWGDDMAGTGLPDDKIVWTYHPVTFVEWINKKMKGTAQASKAIEEKGAYRGVKAPSEIKDDAEATDGFMDDEDALFGEAAKKLDLEKLSNGYPD